MEPEDCDPMDNCNNNITRNDHLLTPEARIDLEMMEWLSRLQNNRRLPDSIFYPLLFAYAIMIMFGVLANGLIITLVLRQRSRHQLRHLLMINLSVSDLLLCLVTMPLTFMELVCFSWPLGNYPLLCKLAGSMEGVSVYCSTLTIASIAMDRYHLIVFPVRREGPIGYWTVSCLLLGIWTGSLLLACPLFLFRSLKHLPLNEELLGIPSIEFCVEEWPDSSPAALIYSLASTLFQFLIPAIIIVFAHASICARLRRRFQGTSRRAGAHRPKTHHLLSAIALTFALCWIPLNLFNILDAFFFVLSDVQQLKLTVYAICHLAGMSSACLNPVFYGWLNHNLRAELVRLFPQLVRYTKPASNTTTTANNNTTIQAQLTLADAISYV
ncbi:NPFG-protein-coupled receptor [Daphnia sinensis]|uniref:NPFG-protein-coupled receptor n=1 Tax=Daphnia sinensis TaxID=1820382 RepID=A0AAD5KQ91_9CRUS|nr:NPFG-protein-coupled receptor [Daphnia sinensis]